MVNVYLSGADARNAAADLWQSDQLKRVNDQFAPPPEDQAQPLPPAPVEAAGVQGSSLPSPSAVGPAMTQPAPPAAVPALVVHPNPTPDRNDLADHFTRNAIADAWEQNALADVTKGVSQAGAGVQSALADVPKEAQGLVSNLSALPGASAGIPAPQPTQGQVATVTGGQPPTAGSVQAATATTAGISGGGDLSGRIGDRGMQIMASGAQTASWLGGEGQKALQAVLLTEGGLAGARGDQGKSAGPLQFYEGGQLANFAQQMGLGLEQAKQYVEAHPESAIQWAIGTPDRPGYLGGAIQAGLKAGLTGADLATYAQRHGQVSVSPERAGQNWQSLFGSGQTAVAQGPGGDQQMASAQPVSRPADDWLAIAKEQLGKPYIWGSAGGRSTFDPSAPGFDCSGFVSYVMKKAFGVDLPAFTGTAYTATRPLQEGETPGAAGQVAFYNMGQSDPHLQHIALSIGDGKVIQAGGRRNDVNTDVANDIGTPEWRVPVGIPGKLADAAQQVVGAGAAAAQTGQNVQQAVQQTAQGIIGAVGNVGSALGTAANNVGGALNSPNLPGQIYQNSPIGAFNTATQQIGQNVVSPAIEAITQPGGALIGPRTAAAGVLENVASNVPSGVPVVAGALQHAAGMVGGPTVIDQIGMVQDLANKYPSAVPGLPDVNRMTPQDQAQWSNLMIGVGGITGGEGAGGESLASKAGNLEAQARPPAQQFTAEGVEVPPRPANPFQLETAPVPGAAALTGDQAAQHLEDLQARYTANDNQVAALENRLYGGGLTSGKGSFTGGVVRPPWAPGWTSDALTQVAQQHGVSPYQDLWWEQAGLNTGSAEVKRLSESGLKGTGNLQQSPTQVRAELARLRAENEQILAAADHMIDNSDSTFYRREMPVTSGADLPFAEYNAGSAGPTATATQTNASGPNTGSAPGYPSNAPQGVGAPVGSGAPSPVAAAAQPVTVAPATPPAGTPPTTTGALGGGAPPRPPAAAVGPGAVPAPVPTGPLGNATPWDILRTARVGSLAGGVPTVTHIALNTPLQAGWKLFTNTAQDIVTGHPEAVPMQFVGAWQGLRNWAMNASQTLTQPGVLAQKMGGGAGAQAVETGLLGLVKTHPLLQDLAGQLGANMELWRSAAKGATDAGLTRFSGPWQAEVQRLVSTPTPEIQTAVQRAQDVASLRGPMGFQGQKVADWLQNNELGRFILPFFNIGYHVAAQGIERSPAGFIGTAYDVARSKLGAGPYAAGAVDKAVTPLAERFYNNLVGTGLFMEAYSQAAQGNITGNGPDDPAQRAELMSQGWMPNSTLVGGRWVDNHVLGPAGWALAEAANLAEARGDTPYTRGTKAAEQRQDGMQQAANYLTRMGTYLQDETFLRSFGQLLQAASSGAQAGRMGESVAASVAGSLIPQGALIANVASAQDPYARRAQPGNIAESLMARLPGQREQVPVRMNALGEPEQNPQYGAGILLPRSGTGQPSPVLTLLAGAGITLPATPPKDINYSGRQLTLTPDEQQLRQQMLGQRLTQTTQGYVNSAKFQALAPDQQKRALEPLVRAAEQYADQRVVAAMTPEERRTRLAAAPRTGAYAPVYPAAGSGLASIVARQSAADADAAHQRLLAQNAGQPVQPQLAGVGP